MSTSYSQLVSDLQALLEDDSSEFNSYIPQAIALAEERLTKELDTLGLLSHNTVLVSSGQYLIDKPTNYRVGHNLTYEASGERFYLIKKTLSWCEDYWPVITSTGSPKYFSDYSQTQFFLVPPPSSDITVRVDSDNKPVPLDATTSTNYFTDSCSDALFFAAARELCDFSRDFILRDRMEAAYQNAVLGLNNQGRRERREDAFAPLNPNPERNTLKAEN